MNEVMKTGGSAIADWAPKTFEQAMEFSEMVCQTDFVPKNYKGKANDCFMAMTFGNEIGLGPMAALQNIAVINGKPALYGDSVLALCKSHPSYEGIKEEYDTQHNRYVCTVKRKGEEAVTQTFSLDEARNAGLLDKAGPWKTYPKRMLQMRARAWALRDAFPDVLNGISVREEAQDIPMENVTPEKPLQHDLPAEEVTGTVEDQPQDETLAALMKDLEDSLSEAVKNEIITEEEKTTVIERAQGKQSPMVLGTYADKIGKWIAESAEKKEQGNE